ncbi:hypothetical protein CTRI78_v011867 [Colletotrichum trifolii]|uniref:Uncharacterized protein n=1 Tax=Colletotrichum trifolii TaxID=5466 RepID=A0A4R8Q5V7_COLTR|nr:hypothetical protein CTRI78_v011867 [Colletotrichum trifolii]
MFTSSRWTAWGAEYWAVAGATVSLAAMMTLLARFDGKGVFAWHGVTLNTVVSILSVTIKASIAFVIAECMAQWKWILFAREERPLIDFDRIDEATRGPLGSLRIILRTRSAWAVQFGAVLTMLAIGLDPLAQQLIQLEEAVVFTRSSRSENGTLALNSRATSYRMGRSMVTKRQIINSTTYNYDVATNLPLSMEGAVLSGLSRSPWETEQEAMVQCPTSNCTFDTFNTIGICQRCNDVTSDLRRVEDFGQVLLAVPQPGSSNSRQFAGDGIPSTAFALPNGHFLANIDGCPPYNGLFSSIAGCKNEQPIGIYSDQKYSATSFGTGNPNKTVTMRDIDTLLWSMSVIYPDVQALNKSASFTPGKSSGQSDDNLVYWPDVPVKATECALYYCIKQVDSVIEGNQLKESVTEAPGTRRDPDSWERLNEKADGQPENIIPKDEKGTLEFNKYWSVVSYTDLVLEFTDDRVDGRYLMSADSVKALSSHFQDLFRGNWDNSTDLREALDRKLGNGAVGFNGASFGPYESLQGGMEAVPPGLNGVWTWTRSNVSSVFRSLATSMTNEMRRNFEPEQAGRSGQDGTRPRDGTLSYLGNVGRSATLYRIVWPWIALHAVMLLSSALFLFLTLSNSRGHGDVPLWKGSSLAAMRHGRDIGHVLDHSATIEDMEDTARRVSVRMRRDNTEETMSWIDHSDKPVPNAQQ